MKKVLSLVLTLAMVLSMFSFSFVASAETAMPEGAIAIDSVAGLKAMEAGKYYYLTKDLTIGSAGTVAEGFTNSDAGPSADADWETKPVEEELITIPAGATLDGNGKTIYYGYYITNPGMYSETEPYTQSLAWSHAIFAIADGDTVTVKNLKFGSKEAPILYSESATVYGLFADASANTDVIFDGITIWGHRGDRGLSNANMGLLMTNAGGLIEVKNSRVEGEWISAGKAIGGFFYSTVADTTLTVTDCVSNARLAGSEVAGIMAYNNTGYVNTLSFIRCQNTYTANALSGSGGVGGILWNPGGATSSIYLEDCVNYANLTLGNNLGAGIVGRVQGSAMGSLTVKNCVNYGKVTSTKAITGNHGMGGVLGHVGAKNFTIINCSNYGDVTGTSNLGGVIGRIDGAAISATVSGCKNYGTVKNTSTVTGSEIYVQTAGGILGQVNGSGVPAVLIENCVNYGTINPGSSGAAAAGIISAGHGKSHTWTINNCKNFGSIGTSSGIRAGGIVGYTIYVATMNLNNCENYGTIVSSQYVGGIVCNMYQGTGYVYTLNNCKNFGEIQGCHIVGGVIGRLGHNVKLTVNKCLNAGTVKPLWLSSGESLGGIVGWISNTSVNLTIQNCVNTGDVYGSTKNSQAYGAYGDMFGQIIGAYGRTGDIGNYAGNAYVGGFINWSAAAYTPVLTNCYAYGNAILGDGAKSLTGWIIGYDNNGTPAKYTATTDYVTSTVAATVPNGGAYGINVQVAENSTVYYLKDTTAAAAAKKATDVLGVEMIAGADDENALVIATPEIRGLQMSLDGTSVRFVAGISSSNYDSIGYIYSVSFNGNPVITDAQATSDYVMLAVNATGSDGTITSVTASSLCAKYLTAITFNGVPAQGTLVITAAPTATTGDTTYVGASYTITIVDGVLVSAVESAPADKVVAGSDMAVSSEDAGIVIDYEA